METTYFICRNPHCEKHRNIFAEGDQLHQNCERERLRFAGEQRVPVWAWAAVPLAIAALALAVQAFRAAAKRTPPQRDTHRPVARESERHTAPPPIAKASS